MVLLLFFFLHCLFLHNAWIPEGSYYSQNYAGIIAQVYSLRLVPNHVVDDLLYLHNCSCAGAQHWRALNFFHSAS